MAPLHRFAAFCAPALVCAALASPALGADPPKCQLVRIAEWPVRLERNLPVIEGSIDGKKVGILLDTGAYATVLTKAAAEKLGIAASPTATSMIGVGGESRIYLSRIQELRIGGAVRNNLRVRVAGERPIPGVDFILGDDFFRGLDLEFDYAKGVVRLFQPLGCKGASLGYWDANALQVPMEQGEKIILPVEINGRPARALLDSGASASSVSMPFAARLGITPQTPGVAQSGCSGGIGGEIVPRWVARFDTVSIAGETIRDPRLLIGDLIPEVAYGTHAHPEMILGTDFLRAHRVLVARSQQKVYFSYAGGLVFPSTPKLACEDRPRGGDRTEQLAAYDEVLEKNPNDAATLVRRGVLRASGKDTQGALADLTAAIRLEPRNAVALEARASVRAALRDFDGALADSQAAIDNGMHHAGIYLMRGLFRIAQGNWERAADEFGEALKLDPSHVGALDSRARANFYTGRYEAAERDFSQLLLARKEPFDSIWIYLSRARRGVDGRAPLEQALAKLKESEWPAPIMLFQLGGLDRAGLMAAAANGDEKAQKGQLCEARFYLAQSLLLGSDKSEVRPLLEKARDECPRDYAEYHAAIVELKRLQ